MDEEGYDPLQNLYEEEQARREQERYAQIEQETFDRDIEVLMSTEQGRRFAWRLLERSGVFLSTFNPKATDLGMNMAFEEGKKQAGYWLLSEIQRLCPQQYFVMTEEQKKWQMNRLRLARQA
ncbi:endopeptidase [uncultured Parasutterella sp.]|uniref:Bbp19 family protein n=1 Tax=uncultured Parasutterella sp. TaxID=1263098 RepID=UPI00272DC612|nr:endopeptidase [uncultured Parasutterella sp.]